MKDIQLLIKKDNLLGKYTNIYPKTYTDAIIDKESGKSLHDILLSFNMYFLNYTGNTATTRLKVPTIVRKRGLWITYVKYDNNVYTEWYAGELTDDTSWLDSANWRVGNSSLVGDITISSNGNWVVNGIETEFKAIGEAGITPILRIQDNKLLVSYNQGTSYTNISDTPVYTRFRWLATTGNSLSSTIGRILASTDDGKSWTNMSDDFINNLHISKYIGANESLPTSGISVGTIYAKGPTYAEDDTNNDNPIYRLWVYAWKGNTLAWQDNGEFTSIAAGIVQETGNSETNVMSQKATTEAILELSEYFHFNTPTVGEVDGGVYVNSSGVITAGSMHRGIYYFPVQKGDIIHFRTKNSDNSVLSAAAIAVTSDITPVVGSPVLEYQYWSDVPEVDAFYVVKNVGTLYYFVYLPNSQTTSCKVVEPIDKTLIPIERTAGIVYFSLGKSPSFDNIANGISVQLPDGGMFYIYSQYKGELKGFNYETQASATFNITNKKSLVLDFSDDTFKVVDTGTVGNYVTMLSYTGNKAVEGLFKPYYDAWVNKGNALIEYQVGSGYINLGFAPTFEKISNGIHVAFPYSGYKIKIFNSITGTAFEKDIDSNDITGYDLTNLKSLVVDLNDSNSLKVINSGTAGNYIVLLTYVSSGAVDGIFASYYNIWNMNRAINGEPIVPMEDYWDENLCKHNILNQIKQGDLAALFFSDIHGNDTEFSRIITLANKWRNYINVVIDGGDDTQSYQSLTNLDWYNTLAATSVKPIIRAVGNHDAWVNSNWDWATPQQVYEYFTAPAVTLMRTKGLTVVQPSDAATAYRNYYYIDFGNIRVIVLLSLTMGEDNRYYDNNQDTWFKSVLSDALTNSKSVICVNHGPLNPNSCNQVKSNWSSFKKWNTIADNQHVDDAAVAAVDDFIDNGGTFICWLSGHTHIDYLLTSNTGTHKQLCFTTSCAKNGTMDGLQPNSLKDPYYDLLNFFSVDLTNKFVKVWRIGFNNNYALQEHNTFCWDYENEVMISET